MKGSNAVTAATLQSLFGEETDDDSSLSSCNANQPTTDAGYDRSGGEDDIANNKRKRESTATTATPPETETITESDNNTEQQQQQQSVVGKNSCCQNNKNNNNSWSQKIGVLDGVLTLDECDELIAVHSSEAHNGYIDHLEVTRVSDLVAGGSSDHLPSPSLPLVLPLLRARYKMWEALEECFPNETALEVVPEYTALTAWHSKAFLRMHYDSNKEYLKDRHYSAILYLNDPNDLEIQIDRDNGNGNDNDNDNPASNSNQQQQQQQNHHPKNYHRSGFSGGDLVFEIPSSSNATATNNTNNNNNNNNNTAGTRIGDQEGSATKTKAATTVVATNTNTNNTNTNTNTTKRIRPRAGRLVCFPSSSDYVHGVEEIKKGTRYALTMWFTKHIHAMESLESLQQSYYCYSHSNYSNGRRVRQKQQQQQQKTIIEQRPLPTKTLPLPQQSSRRLFLQQPWETPQQAVALRLRTLERAGLPKLGSLSLQHRTTKRQHERTTITTTTQHTTVVMTQSELLQLIAHCWWKKGLPLGDLLASGTRTPAVTQTGQLESETAATTIKTTEIEPTTPTVDDHTKTMMMEPLESWTLEGAATQEFSILFRDWKEDYVPRRSKGLASALERWMNHECGLITSVRDHEME